MCLCVLLICKYKRKTTEGIKTISSSQTEVTCYWIYWVQYFYWFCWCVISGRVWSENINTEEFQQHISVRVLFAVEVLPGPES